MVGRKQAFTRSALVVERDHILSFLELFVRRMQRRQKAPGQMKSAITASLRDPAIRTAYDEVGQGPRFGSRPPRCKPEGAAEAFRVIIPTRRCRSTRTESDMRKGGSRLIERR